MSSPNLSVHPTAQKPAITEWQKFWFDSPQALQATMGSAEGRATGTDLVNFARGGVSLLVGAVEK